MRFSKPWKNHIGGPSDPKVRSYLTDLARLGLNAFLGFGFPPEPKPQILSDVGQLISLPAPNDRWSLVRVRLCGVFRAAFDMFLVRSVRCGRLYRFLRFRLIAFRCGWRISLKLGTNNDLDRTTKTILLDWADGSESNIKGV